MVNKASKANWERLNEATDRQFNDGNVGIRDKSTGEGYVVSGTLWALAMKGDADALKALANKADARDISRKAGQKRKPVKPVPGAAAAKPADGKADDKAKPDAKASKGVRDKRKSNKRQ